MHPKAAAQQGYTQWLVMTQCSQSLLVLVGRLLFIIFENQNNKVNHMKSWKLVFSVSLFCLFSSIAFAKDKPNIVLVFMDNFGYGELGVYGGGILRGAPTPRIDQLASEGMRLLNFNVEAQCTPSRAAIMTGRYAIRTGNASVPLDIEFYGLTQWEQTMPEMLSEPR